MDFQVKKAISGANWWCLWFNGVMLETFDRKWQAEEAIVRYKVMLS